MRQLSLEETRRIELEILRHFDSFCKDNQIRYFLSNGTLLGAVKYKGFIPWDDDIDVLVPREDYNKLIELYVDDEKYRLFSFERDNKFLFPFAKLCSMKTIKKEYNVDSGPELGVDIDIFPLDAWHPNWDKAAREARWIHRMLFFLTLTKQSKPDSAHPIKRIAKGFLMLFCKILGGRFFVKKIVRASNNWRAESKYLGCKSWCIYREREIVPSKAFCDSVDLSFEGELFPAPVGYDIYLRSLYGDYKKDPPIEKRQSHHNFTAYLK